MKIFYFAVLLILLIPNISAAHFIVGIVNNALDGTAANDHIVVLWNPAVGENDNLTDIIGPNGNSGADNIFMIDCELLNAGCNVGNEIRVKVINNGDNYIADYVNLTVTGAGYDTAPNLTLSSPSNITSVVVDDSIAVPADEIDLTAASNRTVICEAIVEGLDGNYLQNATAIFFDNANSNYGDSDDNNDHYTNNSCYINASYGNENQSQVLCNFEISYYANPGTWECILKVVDSFNISSNKSDITSINTLLSIGLPSAADFGVVNATEVSNEFKLNVTNYGNLKINLSLLGFAIYEGDNLSMNCTFGATKNISVIYTKYNLTDSNTSTMTLSEFQLYYSDLTDSPTVKKFDLDYRKQDSYNEATRETYWRIYVPAVASGSCQGKIVFGASNAAGT
jgi:hypothetical protein